MTKTIDFPIQLLPTEGDSQSYSKRDMAQTLMLEKAQILNKVATGKAVMTPGLQEAILRVDRLLADLGYPV